VHVLVPILTVAKPWVELPHLHKHLTRARKQNNNNNNTKGTLANNKKYQDKEE
jgi:hypothetical protein